MKETLETAIKTLTTSAEKHFITIWGKFNGGYWDYRNDPIGVAGIEDTWVELLSDPEYVGVKVAFSTTAEEAVKAIKKNFTALQKTKLNIIKLNLEGRGVDDLCKIVNKQVALYKSVYNAYSVEDKIKNAEVWVKTSAFLLGLLMIYYKCNRPFKNKPTIFDASSSTLDISTEVITNTSQEEIRGIVELFYDIQAKRIATDAQIREASALGRNTVILQYFSDKFTAQEKDMVKVLKKYVEHHPIGQWMMKQSGLGPVLSAGLLSYIDITKCKCAGSIQRYAGLDPTVKWNKGEKRPWNAKLKVICWKLGESFVKVSGKEDAVYGKFYRDKKQYYLEMNEKGEYADRSTRILSEKNWGKTTESYKAYINGKLPLAHINNMAKRWAVKMFISDLFSVWYKYEYGVEPPTPYVIAHMGHTDIHYPPDSDVKFRMKSLDTSISKEYEGKEKD